jgi:DNA-binding NarL/FixJ family response regulator
LAIAKTVNPRNQTGILDPLARRLYVIQDDLMFAQRALAAARRLAVSVQTISPAEARTHAWTSDDVVVLQATLRPQQQLALIEQLVQHAPPPIVVAVTGHLETELGRQLKAKGARLAAHSAIDRALARALEISGDGARDARETPPPS